MTKTLETALNIEFQWTLRFQSSLELVFRKRTEGNVLEDTLDEKCSECGQGVLESRILISKTGYLGRFYAKKWPRCTASRSCRTIWCIFGATFWTISLCCQRTLTLTASNCANRVQSQIYLDSAEVQTIECNLLQMRHLYLEHAS